MKKYIAFKSLVTRKVQEKCLEKCLFFLGVLFLVYTFIVRICFKKL